MPAFGASRRPGSGQDRLRASHKRAGAFCVRRCRSVPRDKRTTRVAGLGGISRNDGLARRERGGPMILFAGIPSEPPVAFAIESAERRGIPYLVLNQRRWLFCDLQIEMRNNELSAKLWLDEKPWNLAEFTGIYSRIVDPNTLPEHQSRGRVMPDPRQLARSEFLHDLFNDWLEIAPGRIVNRPNAMASNVSK